MHDACTIEDWVRVPPAPHTFNLMNDPNREHRYSKNIYVGLGEWQ